MKNLLTAAIVVLGLCVFTGYPYPITSEQTTLVVLGLAGVWLGWSFCDVRQRGKMLAYLARNHSASVHTEPSSPQQTHPWRVQKMPWRWSLLGGTPVNRIILHSDAYCRADCRYIAEWFPEADVTLVRHSEGNNNLSIEGYP